MTIEGPGEGIRKKNECFEWEKFFFLIKLG